MNNVINIMFMDNYHGLGFINKKRYLKLWRKDPNRIDYVVGRKGSVKKQNKN